MTSTPQLQMQYPNCLDNRQCGLSILENFDDTSKSKPTTAAFAVTTTRRKGGRSL